MLRSNIKECSGLYKEFVPDRSYRQIQRIDFHKKNAKMSVIGRIGNEKVFLETSVGRNFGQIRFSVFQSALGPYFEQLLCDLHRIKKSRDWPNLLVIW